MADVYVYVWHGIVTDVYVPAADGKTFIVIDDDRDEGLQRSPAVDCSDVLDMPADLRAVLEIEPHTPLEVSEDD